MKSSVTISLAPSLIGGPWIYWDGLAVSIGKAAAAGFDAVELFFDDPESIDAGALRSLLQRHRLRLAAVGTGAGKVFHGWTLTDAEAGVRSKARQYIRRIIDFGAPFGAPAIIGSMQGSVAKGLEREQCLDWLAEGLRELSKAASDQGVPLLFEPLNRYETNVFNRVGDAASFLATRDLQGVRVLADLFHMNIEEASVDHAIVEAGGAIGHVHFADSNRRPMGLGHLDMAPVAAALKRIGYEGYLSAEALAYPDADGAAAQTMTAYRRWFG
jgi:sugar phosphate isomerase/epimerase